MFAGGAAEAAAKRSLLGLVTSMHKEACVRPTGAMVAKRVTRIISRYTKQQQRGSA